MFLLKKIKIHKFKIKLIPFLQKLSGHLLEKYSEDISNICIIFPSKRAGIYFRKYLSGMLDKPIWAPAIYSIEEFVGENSKYIIADELVLIFELYKVFKKYGENETFDQFYPWGSMLLKDFDEMDKNLVPAKDLFRVTKEIKNVEDLFSLPLEELEHFNAFWRTFSNRELTEAQSEFLKIWEKLDLIYFEFKENLDKKNLAYDGMSLRDLANKFGNDDTLFSQWKKIIFAGFNSLSAGEEKIIKKLLKKERAEIFWDSDKYYFENENHEAGYFLKKNFKNLNIKTPNWVEDNLNSSHKNIDIIGAPVNIGQVKALGNKLENRIKKSNINLDNTVIILPDENILLPVLYSIPSVVDKMNITMGFPFKNTTLFSLIQLLKDLQLNKKISGNNCVFYHKNVSEILMHTHVKYSAPKYIYDIVHDIRKFNLIYLTRKQIIEDESSAPELLSLIFNPITETDDILNYLFKILDFISKNVEYPKEDFAKFELEYFYSMYEQLNRLSDIAAGYNEPIGEEVFWHILIECLKSVKIPFTGEPLGGLQVMGLLESRALDFENVFILSMNEGIMPRGNLHGSFIPYNLRKAFKLPTYEDNDAVTSYYFYRLLQRAKNVFLFYNTETNDVYSGEQSRFLLQIESELKDNPGCSINKYILQTGIESFTKNEISIDKTPSLIDRMLKVEKYSATDIINYVNCGLKFYLNKIAGLRMEEEVEEFFSPLTFGKLFHSIMQILYCEYEGKVIDKKDIDSVKKYFKENYDSVLQKAFSEIPELKMVKPDLLGRNLLFKNVIRKLILKVLDNEIREVPFKLIKTEMPVTKEIVFVSNGIDYKVPVYGRIDRIDEKNGIIRIIDYKTGIYNPKTKPFDEGNFISAYFDDPKLKENLQAALYGYLYLTNYPGSKVKLGIYPIRNLDEGIAFNENLDLSASGFTEFENNLKNLFSELFDKEKPITQTNEIERCKYCSFVSICYRE